MVVSGDLLGKFDSKSSTYEKFRNSIAEIHPDRVRCGAIMSR